MDTASKGPEKSEHEEVENTQPKQDTSEPKGEEPKNKAQEYVDTIRNQWTPWLTHFQTKTNAEMLLLWGHAEESERTPEVR
jgi:hypothetical protein